jgi:DNA (cytosine-5)-methyltransferase 1
MRPRLLDLFCGAGGAAMGYHRAGFDVVGVDIRPQPNYPFDFIQADALGLLRIWIRGNAIGAYDAIHASPPCQSYSSSTKHFGATALMLIEPVRDLFSSSSLPWVIENVPGSPLPRQSTLTGQHGVELCGSMFDLRVRRHRLFETSFPIAAPRGCDHSYTVINPYNAKARKRDNITRKSGLSFGRAMEIDWMSTEDQVSQSIPPAYTEFIGTQLLAHLKVAA